MCRRIWHDDRNRQARLYGAWQLGFGGVWGQPCLLWRGPDPSWEEVRTGSKVSSSFHQGKGNAANYYALNRLVRRILDLYEKGYIRPISPQTVFPGSDVHEAFRYMQRGLHMGKLVIKMPEPSQEDLVAKARVRICLSPNLSYILVGGLGGIGRAIATWMMERGARNLTFLSRSAGASSADQSFSRELEVQGCKVNMLKGDVTVLEDVQAAIRNSPCPIGGILQLSMIVRVSELPFIPRIRKC